VRHSRKAPTMKIYIDRADLWIGVYTGPLHIYVCPLPCIVLRFDRSRRSAQRRAIRRRGPVPSVASTPEIAPRGSMLADDGNGNRSFAETARAQHDVTRPVDLNAERPHLSIRPDGTPVLAELAAALADDMRDRGLSELLPTSADPGSYMSRQCLVEVVRSLDRIAAIS
jgi:hypothetical protein